MNDINSYAKGSLRKKITNVVVIALLITASFMVLYTDRVRASPDVDPFQSTEYPTNATTNVSFPLFLNVTVGDNDTVDTMNATWMSNSSGTWATFATNSSIANNTNITQANGNFSSPGTKYWWSVNLSDGLNWYNATYSFTTNYAPTQSGVGPNNNSKMNTSNPALFVTCSDTDSDTMAAYWYSNSSGSSVLFGTNSSVNTGTNITQTNSNFTNASESCWWTVKLTDGKNWTNSTYKIRGQYRAYVPTSFSASASSTAAIALSWTKGGNATYTYIEWSSSSTRWTKGSGTQLYNGTGSSTTHSGLSASTTRYYQAWSYNAVDNLWSSSNVTTSATTSSSGGGTTSGGTSSSTDDTTTDDTTTDDTTEESGTQTSEETTDSIETEFDITLTETFYANDTDGDGALDTLTDPNDVLTQVDYINMSGSDTFLISTGDDDVPEFFWDTTTDTTTKITHSPGTVTETATDTEAETVTLTVSVEKSDWIYIEIEDSYPNYPLTVKNESGATISLDYVWRKNGKIYVLDDPDTTYEFVYDSSLLDPEISPASGEEFTTAKPTITLTYYEEVNITSATFGGTDILSLITTTDNLTFTYAQDTNLTEGTYILSVTAQDSDMNNLTTTATYTIQLPVEDEPETPGTSTKKPDEGFPIIYLIIIAVILIILLIVAFLFKIGYLYIEDKSDKSKSTKKKSDGKNKK